MEFVASCEDSRGRIKEVERNGREKEEKREERQDYLYFPRNR